ncbi:MAG: hypothetical protein LBK64_07410 [Spirochaetaceae bacterium]|jgi:hypothetical protein|nr:hypothetical protein [Spirochaetaceae bacterium]
MNTIERARREGRKAMAALTVLPAALLLAGLFSCAALDPAAGGASGKAENAGNAGSGVPSRGLAGLPEEARQYLNTLAEAFASGDEAFLIGQGEAMYENLMLPRYDKEAYLALLYRAGPYAEESGIEAARLPRLNPDAVRGIEYLGWKEESFLIEVQGRLLMKNGPPLSCRILLHWKLEPPKIIGGMP